METNMKSTSIPQSQQKGKTPTFHVQTGLRAGAPNTDEMLILKNWDEIRSSIGNFFDRFRAKFGTNI
jgi:hypothetical protein